MELDPKPKFIGQKTVETQLLTKELAKLNDSSTDTYARLAGVVGMKPNDPKFHGYLRTARNEVLKLHGKVVEPLGGDDRGTGVICLGDIDKIGLASAVLKSIRRKAKKGAQKASTIDLMALNEGERRRAIVQQSALGVMAHFAKPNQVDKTAKTITIKPDQKLIGHEELLAHFSN